MSYTKFYEPMFIKVQGDFLPMIMSGDSSLREFYSNKIVRSWAKLSTQKNGKRSYLSSEKDLKEEYRRAWNEMKDRSTVLSFNPASYGWNVGLAIGNKHTTSTTFKDYKNFILRGIKTAVSFEDLKRENKSLRIFVYSWDGDLEKQTGHKELSRQVDEEKDFLDTLNEFESAIKGTKKEGQIYFEIMGLYDEGDVKDFKRAIKSGYVIQNDYKDAYIVSITKKCRVTNFDIKKAKVYATREAAEKTMLKYGLKGYNVLMKF